MYLHNLRGILADLYPDANDARRLADDAQLSVSSINFNGPAENVWQDVLTQAVNEEKFGELLQQAIDEYPNNSKLLMAAWTYKQDAEHIIAVSNGEYERMSNGNSFGRVDTRIDQLNEQVQGMRDRLGKLEYQVEDLMRASSSESALDAKTLIIAVLVAVVMFAALYALRF
jgi:hypothetical protein